MSVIQRIGAVINDAVTTLFSTWSSTKISNEIAASAGADYTTDYYVSDDIGDDTNTGLSERNAFKTLEAALDAGEAGGVPYAIHILDDSSYEVQAASGTRTDTVEFIIDCPTGTITGPAAGALIWKVPSHKIKADEINGTNLTFQASTTLIECQHDFQKITDPNLLYQSVGVAQDASRYNVFVNNVRGDGAFCDLTNRGKLYLTLNFLGVTFSGGTNSVFTASGVDTNLFIRGHNIDANGGTRRIVDLSGGAIGFIEAVCSSHTVGQFAIVDGTGSELFAINSSDGNLNPLGFIETNGGRVHSSSPSEGFDFDDLNATTGLDLADIFNVRDISTGEQVKVTLTELQTLFSSGFVTLATTQSVTGIKTFTAPLTVQDGTGSGLAPNSVADCFVLTSSNVNAGMSLMTIAGGNTNVYFGETGNSDKAAHIQYIGSVNELRLGAGNINVQRISSTNVLFETKIQVRDGAIFRFEVETDGTLTVGDTANYEALVTDDDDIPNKKYVDDAISGGYPTIINKAFADTGYVAKDKEFIIVDTTGGDTTINLPAVATSSGFQIQVMKKVAANTLTVDANLAETINGATTQDITTIYDTFRLICDGTEWYIA